MIMKDKTLEKNIQICIELLNLALPSKPESISDFELCDWIPNCIKFFEYWLNNEANLQENPKFYGDILGIISLIYRWVNGEDSYSYILLREQFKTIYSGAEAGRGLKKFADLLSAVVGNKKESPLNSHEIEEAELSLRELGIKLSDSSEGWKSFDEILGELQLKWNSISR